jgi:hypothetical protein
MGMTDDQNEGGITFYFRPGAPGATPEHEKMLRAHDDEAAKHGAEFWNYGKYIDKYFISSKTTMGYLDSRIDPKTMKVEHRWELYANALN